jgi:hypothetical protein
MSPLDLQCVSGDYPGEVWHRVLAKAVANRAAQEVTSGGGLNSAAARGEPNLTGKLGAGPWRLPQGEAKHDI